MLFKDEFIFFCWTQKKIFWRVVSNQAVDSSHWLPLYEQNINTNTMEDNVNLFGNKKYSTIHLSANWMLFFQTVKCILITVKKKVTVY